MHVNHYAGAEEVNTSVAHQEGLDQRQIEIEAFFIYQVNYNLFVCMCVCLRVSLCVCDYHMLCSTYKVQPG